jgi:hypothetical protein
LREAVVEQYAVFALHFAGEAPAHERLLGLTQAAAHHLSNWLGVDLLAEVGQQVADAPWPAWEHDVQVCRIPYRFSPDGVWAGFLYVQARHDTLLVQIAYARPGAADEAVVCNLWQAVWSPPADDPHFLGQTVCLGGIVEGEEGAWHWARVGLSRCRDRQVSEAEWNPAGLRHLDLSYASLFDHPQAPDALALFYKDEAEEQEASVRLFNTALPDLVLPVHKARHQFRGYAAALKAELEDAEKRLAAALGGVSPPATNLTGLESQVKRVAKAYGDFAHQMGRFAAVEQTVRINESNFEAALARYELPAQGPLAALQAIIRRTVQQMEADEGYYRSAIEGAGVTLDTLQVQAQIERGQVEAERNVIIAFLGVVLAAGQLLNDEVVRAFVAWGATLLRQAPPVFSPGDLFWARLALSVLMGCLGLGVVWLFEQRQN